MQFFSILFCPECIFCVCILPKPPSFLHCTVPQMHFFSIVFSPECIFLAVFCRNL
jgi:hypothetical protein